MKKKKDDFDFKEKSAYGYVSPSEEFNIRISAYKKTIKTWILAGCEQISADYLLIGIFSLTIGLLQLIPAKFKDKSILFEKTLPGVSLPKIEYSGQTFKHLKFDQNPYWLSDVKMYDDYITIKPSILHHSQNKQYYLGIIKDKKNELNSSASSKNNLTKDVSAIRTKTSKFYPIRARSVSETIKDYYYLLDEFPLKLENDLLIKDALISENDENTQTLITNEKSMNASMDVHTMSINLKEYRKLKNVAELLTKQSYFVPDSNNISTDSAHKEKITNFSDFKDIKNFKLLKIKNFQILVKSANPIHERQYGRSYDVHKIKRKKIWGVKQNKLKWTIKNILSEQINNKNKTKIIKVNSEYENFIEKKYKINKLLKNIFYYKNINNIDTDILFSKQKTISDDSFINEYTTDELFNLLNEITNFNETYNNTKKLKIENRKMSGFYYPDSTIKQVKAFL